MYVIVHTEVYISSFFFRLIHSPVTGGPDRRYLSPKSPPFSTDQSCFISTHHFFRFTLWKYNSHLPSSPLAHRAYGVAICVQVNSCVIFFLLLSIIFTRVPCDDGYTSASYAHLYCCVHPSEWIYTYIVYLYQRQIASFFEREGSRLDWNEYKWVGFNPFSFFCIFWKIFPIV